jgi:hypothetical protein
VIIEKKQEFPIREPVPPAENETARTRRLDFTDTRSSPYSYGTSPNEPIELAGEPFRGKTNIEQTLQAGRNSGG